MPVTASTAHQQGSPDLPPFRDNSGKIAAVVVSISLLLMAWHLLAPAEPVPYNSSHNISWGVSFYTKLPLLVQAWGVITLMAALTWAWLAPIRDGEASGTERHAWRWLPLAITLLSVALFALFPVAYSEGDSGLFNRLINNGRLLLEPEPLASYLTIRLYRTFQPLFTMPADAFQVIAVVAGGLYVSATVAIGRIIDRRRNEALIMIGGLLLIGNILVFFRYIEVYAPLFAASVWLIWACWRYMDGAFPLVVPASFLTITCLLHGAGLVWGPMVFVAWLIHSNRRTVESREEAAYREIARSLFVALAIVAAFVLIIVLDGYTYAKFSEKIGELGGKGSGMFIPLFPIEGMPEPYALFSWNHMGAIIQEQLLTAPMALITLLTILVLAWKDVRAIARAKPVVAVLAVGAATSLFHSMIWNPDLGARNDWDLLALPAIPLTILALYLLLHMPDGKPRRLALVAYLSLSAIHTVGWIALHTLGIKV